MIVSVRRKPNARRVGNRRKNEATPDFRMKAGRCSKTKPKDLNDLHAHFDITARRVRVRANLMRRVHQILRGGCVQAG